MANGSAQGYDPQLVQAMQARQQDMMAQKQAESDRYDGPRANSLGGKPPPVSGITIEFVANGFVVAPTIDKFGPSYPGQINKVAHVARDKDELLKLVGEMISAHATA